MRLPGGNHKKERETLNNPEVLDGCMKLFTEKSFNLNENP
jgi:hypothetical protein